ncbi:sensor histidine kinase [Leptolyngbya sp. GGD]|uniref:sensor histidine kinase n=1 Tax=Leptolyngbya sp. GGD TaxID=2997907 RepID=UPI00227AA640|nr:ATP-binding protein [Leptolyngbya sp. GGD]MCY6489158.1 ATP-binding protein [Leptolyngbya sp. GGD]
MRFNPPNLAAHQRNLLVRLLIASVILLVSSGAYYSYQLVRNSMLESLKKNVFLELSQGRDSLDHWLSNQKIHIETLANTEQVKSMNWETTEPYLKAETLRLSDVYAIAVGKPDGWRNVVGGKPANVSDRAYFQKVMQGITNVSDPIISRANNTPTLAIAAPIRQGFDTNSTPIGEIHTLVRLDRVNRVVSSVKYGNHSYAFAIDSQGQIVTHTSHTDNHAHVHFHESELLKALPQMSKSKESVELVKVANQMYYLAYLPLQEVEWALALVIPKEDIESQVQFLDMIALIVAGMAVALLAILVQVQAMEQRHLKKSNELLEKRVEARTKELSDAMTKLQQSQLRMIQSEKMSALGNLVAGVAHEINNPVNFIHGNITYVDEYTQALLHLIQLYQEQFPDGSKSIQEYLAEIDFEFLAQDLEKTLASMRIGTDRIKEIVLSLRNFSRLDEAEVKPVNLHDGIDSTLLILQHRLKATPDQAAVEVVKDYGDLPFVDCYASQLNQVFMNILANALDAMEDQRGLSHSQPCTIRIKTKKLEHGRVQIAIADNGPGIPPEVQPRIFDPFFTTKSIGKGTGMGMSISYQIVTERHQGKLYCVSEVGKGTEFFLEIPIRQGAVLAAPVA